MCESRKIVDLKESRSRARILASERYNARNSHPTFHQSDRSCREGRKMRDTLKFSKFGRADQVILPGHLPERSRAKSIGAMRFMSEISTVKKILAKKIPSVTLARARRSPGTAASPELTMGRGSRARGIKCSRTPAQVH